MQDKLDDIMSALNMIEAHLADIRKDVEALKKEQDKPKEPLIKDPKIRKAVRAWAEANGIDEIVCFDIEAGFEFAGNATRLYIRFGQSLGIDTSRGYVITELCGEEEE